MGYPNIINDIDDINSKIYGQEYITNSLKFKKSYNFITITNPEINNNTERLTSASASEYFSDAGIVAMATNGDTLGQVVIGRQQTINDSGNTLGNCILEHYNGETWANIIVGHNLDGTKFCTTNATLPSITDKSTNVATTQWVKSCLPLNIKAYGCWEFTYLHNSYNCVMNETGNSIYQIQFLSPMDNTYYFVFASAECNGAAMEIIGIYNQSTTGFSMDVSGHTGTTNAKGTTLIRFIVFG